MELAGEPAVAGSVAVATVRGGDAQKCGRPGGECRADGREFDES